MSNVCEATLQRLGICVRCHRKRYAEHICLMESLAQFKEYGPPCRCPDAPVVRNAFDVLEEMARSAD